ncbi:ATP-dependent helicase [Bifidobacterium margollesii]|uniref:ATP-dependent helicase n=1 Tax=Bifidobacterium margollesii TaxID=2020964 RepID=A0A2N5JBM9_9BIFI|nr:ATP-dependent RNA helicase HrpA [Bifidobacterium margollesii]PLS31591.1 ATP-dependent helicase [Bifidobacterium margollesii]
MRFEYPSELPVSSAKDEIAEAVRTHQVVIVSGQTGSGKTTQLPKILLEMGRGTHGHQIVHTQPRRIAARTVAERIASEMGVSLGDEVGFQVRFTDESSPKTRLRVVTDGILLAQIQRDPNLSAYDTIIIDEAHERSLNIDFLLGYLTALLPRRRDLKLIITSATIDSVKFQTHFAEALHEKVPVIEVSGRTYPVQIVYEPLGSGPALMRYVPGFEDSDGEDDETSDMPTAVARACAELVIRSSHERGPRDILVFAAGERDIHDFESSMRRHFGQRCVDMKRPDAIEILPLFARLSAKEQHRVFEPHTHQRIVLATNVAETSLTVPGIRYVVDPGTARISRYSKAAKVQRLPIEPISQASADQRSGRCGRIADGIAIRLYDRDDYENRPRFTEPEILRTALASVVLHMLSVGVARTVSDVTDFGFIDPPDTKAVTNGFNDLVELRAISRSHGDARLTRIGRQLARLPIDVRLARMVIQASGDTPNTLAAILVVVSFLSLQDPRERPEDKRDEADRIHNRYADESSDFLTALNIWDRFFQADGETSNAALRRACKAEFMNYPRMRQWKDLYRQLRQMCRELRFGVGEPLPSSRPGLEVRQLPLNQQAAHSLTCSWDAVGIHKAMLSGLLSSIGMQQVREPKASDFAGLRGPAKARAMKMAAKRAKNEYLGSRGTHFALFPASAVAKSTPQWVMAAELVETSRLWARSSAAIDPAWAEPLAGNLTRTTYAEPHWSASKGAAVASAKILLYGLPIVQDRTVLWGRINPVEARDFLIRQGLVEGDVQQRFPYDDFIDDNRAVLQEADEETSRTRHVVDRVTDEDLVDFYDHVLPADITSIAALGAWWRRHHDENPDLLRFDPSKVERLQTLDEVDLNDYPDHWHTMGSDGTPIDLKLTYVYDPNAENDGVTVHVPLKFLSRISPEQFTWSVPGLLDELIVTTIKSLPKALRVQFVPAPDTARAMRSWIDAHYPDLPGSGDRGHPVAAPVDPSTGAARWPDFTHVFTQAAIAVVGAQVHPEVFGDSQLERLPKHLRMLFAIEKPVADGRGSGRGRGRGRRPRMTVVGSGRSLTDLQRRFAEQAVASARQTVKRQAIKAADQGHVVQSANLLHRAGATTVSRADMLWGAALDALRLPAERISSRWLGAESLMLASAPYKSTQTLVEDLQMAAVKRLLPNIGSIDDDSQLADAVSDVMQVYEDTVYQVSRDVIAILKRYAEVEKAVTGPASLPLLAVLQSIREHADALVKPGFVAAAPPDALRSMERYLHADLLRLEKAKTDKSRDVNWAWQADEARQLVDKALDSARKQPAGPRHDELMAKADTARWLLEEFYVSLWAQELGTPRPVSLKRIAKLLRD